ncbi:MAG: hypothetical protein GXY07_05210 [Candidatus Hydrogenedentes bacterium]|nr:hypothetical protein [Candidatus Hydrogenedentota bacterium]
MSLLVYKILGEIRSLLKKNIYSGTLRLMRGNVANSYQKLKEILTRNFYFIDMSNNPVIPAVVLIMFSLLMIYFAFLRWPCLIDDAFITLTYSKNIVLGRGFVYNYGEPTYGSTSPLLVLIGAALGVLLPWLPLHLLVTLFTALCAIGIGWILLIFHRQFRISPWIAVFMGSAVIIASDPVYLGMESFLFQFLLVLSCTQAFRKRYLSCGVCIALLHLTRAEGVLLLPVLMLYVCVSDFNKGERDIYNLFRPLLRMALGAGVVAGIWTCYAYITFGRITPNTFSAKITALEYTGKGLDFRASWLLYVNNRFKDWGGFFNVYNVFGVMIWSLAGLGIYDIVRYRRRWIIFLLYALAYIIGYSIINIGFHRWYGLPLVLILILSMVLGGARLAGRVLASQRKILMVGMILTVTILFLGVEIYRGVGQSSRKWMDPRAPTYLKVASWLRSNTEPGSSVSIGEIGYIGYFTDNKIVDLVGLVSPEVVPFLAKGDTVGGFMMYKPDYHILIEGCPFSEPILKHPFFIENYTQVACIRGPKPREKMYIYKRKQEICSFNSCVKNSI